MNLKSICLQAMFLGCIVIGAAISLPDVFGRSQDAMCFPDIVSLNLAPGQHGYQSTEGDWFVRASGVSNLTVSSVARGIALGANFEAVNGEVTFGMKTRIETPKSRYLTLSWRTSTNSPTSPGIFIVLDTLSHGEILQPMGMSQDWATTTIDLGELAPNDIVDAVSITAHPWSSDTPEISPFLRGVYRIEVRDLTLSSQNASVVVVLEGSMTVFLFGVAYVFRRDFDWVSLETLSLLFAVVSLCAAVWMVYLPFWQSSLLGIASLLGAVFSAVCAALSTVRNRTGQIPHGLLSEKMFMLTGLLLIPWIAFCIRMSVALTNSAGLFVDEISYGLVSWSMLSRHTIVGAYLRTSFQLVAPSPFVVEPYPSDLPLPYVYAWMGRMKVVHPFFAHPYFLPLVSMPSIALFRFTPLGIRLPYILMSVASVGCVFLIGRRFSATAGLFSSGFVALSNPLSVTYGSKAFLDNGVELFFLSTILLYLQYRTERKNLYLYSAAATAGLCLLSKSGAAEGLLFLLGVLILDSAPMRKIVKALVVSLGIFSSWIVGGLLISYSGFLASMNSIAAYTQTLHTMVSLIPQSLPTVQLLFANWETGFGIACLVFVFGYAYLGQDRDVAWARLLAIGLLAVLIPWLVSDLAKQMWLVIILAILGLAFGSMVSIVRRNRLGLAAGVLTLLLMSASWQNLQALAFPYYKWLMISFVMVSMIAFATPRVEWLGRWKIAREIQIKYVDICCLYVVISLVAMGTLGLATIELM